MLTSTRVFTALLIGMVAALTCQAEVRLTREPTLLEVALSPFVRHDLHVTGAPSCAAAACHGGAQPGTAQGSARRGAEYPLWLQSDPHARSWQSLCSDQGVAMLERLGILRSGQIVDPAGFDNCLACHNTTLRHGRHTPTAPLQEGVGCAACHGPEELWLHEHYRRPLDSAVTHALGLVDNRNLLTRARVCASCHVGDHDRDMNHDMIAAGHPELQFEFATYHARLPKHWRELDEEAGFEARLWLVGQLAALDASLRLLESRAQSAPTTGRWPEFAEYRCADCHQSLSTHTVEDANRSPGFASYSAWHQTGIPSLLDFIRDEGTERPEDRALHDALTELAAGMNRSGNPDPNEIEMLARTGRLALDQWLQSASGNRECQQFDSRRLTQIVEHAEQSGTMAGAWDRLAQAYLAMIATRPIWPDGLHGETAEQLRRRQQALQYPTGQNAPSR